MFRRLLPLALIAAVGSGLALSACGGEDSSDAATTTSPVKLTYAYDDLFTAPFEETFDAAFTNDTGEKVKLQLAGDGYETVYQQLQADAPADALPDVAMVGLNRLRTFVETGLAQPVDELIENDPEFDADALYPAFLKLSQLDGKTYGLPYAVSTPILYINADLFRQAGLDPSKPPQTLEEVGRAAGILKERTDVRHGVYYGWDITGNWLFEAMVESNGGQLTDANGEPAFNEPGGVEILDHWTSLVKSGLMPLVTEAEGEEAFIRGDVGMLVHSTSDLGSIAEGADFDLRTSEQPIPADGTRQTPAGGNALVIFAKDPARQKAAWEAIKAATGVRGSTIITKATGYMPVNRKAAESSELRPLLKEPNRATSLRQLETLNQWYNWPGPRAVEITEEIKDAMFAAMHGDESPQAALDQAAEQVSGLLPGG